MLYAAVFLLAPFFFVRREWRALPAKGISARLLRRARSRLHVLRDHDDPAPRAVPRLSHVLAHGHARRRSSCSPGSARSLSKRFATGRAACCRSCSRCSPRSRSSTCSRLERRHRLAARPGRSRCASSSTLVLLAPLGLCLGMFMPLGLGLVGALTDARRRVRRVVVGRQRVLLGDRLGAHDDPLDDVRLPHRAVPRARRLRDRGACALAPPTDCGTSRR